MSRRVILLCNNSTIHTKLTGWPYKALTSYWEYSVYSVIRMTAMPTTMMMLAGWSGWTRPARRWVFVSCGEILYPLTFTNFLALPAKQQNIKSDYWPVQENYCHLSCPYLVWCCTFTFPDSTCSRRRLRGGRGVRPRCPVTAPWSSAATTAGRAAATKGGELREESWPWP